MLRFVLRALSRLLPPYILAFLALSALIHLPFAPVAHAAAEALGARSPWAAAAACAAAGTLWFLFASRTWRCDHPIRRPVRLLVDLPYWIHWSACLLSLVPAALVTAGWAALSLRRGEPLPLPGPAYAAVYAVALGVSLYGTLYRRRRLVVREVPVPVPGLPAAFEGYRIAQLSDLHVGSLTPARWAREWVEAANACRADLAVVTGDLIYSGDAYHDPAAVAVAGLSAPDGVYVSLGNHDYFGDAEALVARLRARGLCVLRNEGVAIGRGASRLFLAALDDTWTRRDDLAKALAHRPEGAPVVLLAHDPESFREAAARGVELTLSGHTHGGQIRVPWLPPTGKRFRLGRYRLGASTLFVHPGLGTTGPPMRLGVPPTVAVYRLTVAAAVPAREPRRAGRTPAAVT